ncbi:O-antigen ligase family protein [soil metagenome]
MIIVSAILSALTARYGANFGIISTVLLIGTPAIIACIFNLEFGLMFTITLSFFLLGVKRISDDLPLGILMDLLVVIMLFGLFISQIKYKDWSFAKNKVSIMILIWMLYNLLQAANPSSESFLAYVYTVRSYAGLMTIYFLLMYAIRSVEFITRLIKLWIFLMILVMLYGYFQEFVGLRQFELNWIMSDPGRYALLFQAGKFRLFSFFSDPLAYGFSMSFTGILCIVLAGGPFSSRKKIFLRILGVLMLYAMLFSGTRAAYVLPIAAIIFYTVLVQKKKMVVTGIILGIMALIFLNMPSSDPNIVRLQSAFHPGDDASYQTRVKNQAFIQPYIQSHPLGGGLGSVGEWGKKFSPWSPLANFPPDSGYIRIATEMGWGGLLLFCSLLFIIFREGIRDYVRLKDPRLKNYSLAMMTVLFSLVIANFPQEAIGQYPVSILFFVAISIVNKCKSFDEKINCSRLNTVSNLKINLI